MAIKRDIHLLSKKLDMVVDYTYGSDLLPFEFRVVDYELPEGVTAIVYCEGKNELIKEINCSVAGNVISFRPEKWLFDNGNNSVQICISNGGRNLYTFKFIVKCHDSVDGKGSYEPTVEFELLDYDYMFQENRRLDVLQGLVDLMGEGATMRHGFDAATDIEEYNKIINYAKLSAADYMYYNCTNLVDAGEIKTANCESMGNMFNGCIGLLYAGPIDMKSCLDANNMFYNCKNLTGVQLQNTGKTENMSKMFSNCVKLEAAPEIDMSACKYANSMFEKCEAMTEAAQIIMPVCEDANSMFNSCKNLTQVHVSLPSCKNTNAMFYNCNALTTVNKLDLSAVTNAESMFQYCSNLEEVEFTDLKNITSYYARALFGSCSKLKKVTNLLIPKATSIQNIFNGCSSLEEVINFDISGLTKSSSSVFNGWLTGVTTLKRMVFSPEATCVKWFSVANQQFTREGLVELFESLPVNPYTSSVTITGNPGVADLTDEDIAIATSRNFEVIT